MSDRELSKWIAEHIEPSDASVAAGYSPKACWIGNGKHGAGRIVEPNDMVGDPLMTILMLERLASQGSEPCLDALDGTTWEMVVLARDGSTKRTGYIPKLGRAVAEAFVLANS